MLLALKGHGRIDVADAPLQGCDFEALNRLTRIEELLDLYRADYTGVEFAVLDLRKTTYSKSGGALGTAAQPQQRGDPLGYSLIDPRSDEPADRHP